MSTIFIFVLLFGLASSSARNSLITTDADITDGIKRYVDAQIKKVKHEIITEYSCKMKTCMGIEAEDNILKNMENMVFYIRMLQMDVKQLHYGKRILRSNMKHLIRQQVDTVKIFLNKLSEDLFNLSTKVESLEKWSTEADTTTTSTTPVTTTTPTTTSTTTMATTTPYLTPFEGRVRLVGGGGRHEGRVEVYSAKAGQWGTICDTNWDNSDADVVCRMIGHTMGGKAISLAPFGPGSGPILLDDVNCRSNLALLSICSSKNPSAACTHSRDAAVKCHSLESTVESVRLVNGDASKGRVEVLWGGEWGTICSDEWGNRDAKVICRMLGYTSGKARTFGFFGMGTGQIWLNNVRCYGDESTIMHCGHDGWGKYDRNYCDHWSDVGVECS